MIQWLTFSIQLMTALVFFEEAPVGGNKEPFGSSKSSRITNSWSYGPVKRLVVKRLVLRTSQAH